MISIYTRLRRSRRMLMPEVSAAYLMPVLSKASDGPLRQSCRTVDQTTRPPAGGFLAWGRVPYLCEGLPPQGPGIDASARQIVCQAKRITCQPNRPRI